MDYWLTKEDKNNLSKIGLNISEDSFIARRVFLDKRPNTKIEIGEHTTICEGTFILTHDASVQKIGLETRFGDVNIGKNVFIGINSIILLGTTIGDNCIIGAGSVIKGNIPPNEVWCGNPAKFLKTIEQFKKDNSYWLCCKKMTKHIFQIPFTGKTPRSDTQTQEWYDHRTDIFIKYTLESLKSQTNKNFVVWLTFRPQDIDNVNTKKIETALKESGLRFLMTFNGTMFTEDMATWHNFDLVERLEKTLPELKEFIGETDYIYETNLDSDDTVHKTFSEVVCGKTFKNRGSLYMRDGYAFDPNGKLADWHNPTSNQNYTIMFPSDIYFDANKRLEYLNGFKTHEEAPTLFDSEELPKGLYCTLIHGQNISTLWDHPFRGSIYILKDENMKSKLAEFGIYSDKNIYSVKPL